MKIPRTLCLPTILAVALLAESGCSSSQVWGSLLFHTSPDGTELAATYLQPEGGLPAPVFVLLHQPGTARNRNDFDSIWYPLSDQGVALLAPDLRGHGESADADDLGELSHDPLGYPADLSSWFRFLEYRLEEGDALDLDRIALIGLSTSGSLAAAAVGRGQAHCAVAVSATLSEVNALGTGFIDASGDDDDSAGGDDDDSAEFDEGTVDSSLAMHTIRWIYSSGDEPAALDSALLRAATQGDADQVEFPGDAHGVELLWNSDDAKDSMIGWCLSRW